MKRILLVIFLLTITSPKFSFADAQKDISLMVQWFPQAQFAGYIIAQEKGFYEDLGMKVTIKFSDGTDSPLQEVIDNQVDFCTGWLSQAIMLRSENKPIINICQILQRSSLILVARKASGINSPADMKDKLVSNWGGDFSIQPTAFFRKADIDIDIIPQSFRIDGFLVGAIDVTSAMYYNEYHKILQAGIDDDELVTFFFSDYELNFPEDGIYCLEETYIENPELCRNFADASLRGWEYAFQHKEETIDVVMKYCRTYHMQTNRSHQEWMLNAIESALKYRVGDKIKDWGVLSRQDYETVAGELLKQELIKAIPPFEDFYRDVNHEKK